VIPFPKTSKPRVRLADCVGKRIVKASTTTGYDEELILEFDDAFALVASNSGYEGSHYLEEPELDGDHIYALKNRGIISEDDYAAHRNAVARERLEQTAERERREF